MLRPAKPFRNSKAESIVFMRFGALGAPMFLTCSECRRTAKLAAVGRYTFVIPSVFPPNEEEDLYTLTEPFNATGHWTVDVQGCEGTTARFDRDIVASGNVRFVLGAERSTGNSIISALDTSSPSRRRFPNRPHSFSAAWRQLP